MKANKIYLSILTIILFSITGSAFGQTQNGGNAISNINANLERTYAKLEEDIAFLDDSIKLIDAEIEYINGEIDALDKQCRSIDGQLSRARNLQNAINSVNKANNRIKQNVDNLKGDIERCNKEIANLEEIAKIDGEKYVKLALDIHTKPFSSVTCADIDQTKYYLDYFADLECCKGYIPKFEAFEELYNFYLKANRALCEQRTKNEIQGLRNVILPYRREYESTGRVKDITKEQFEELDKLDIALSRYAKGISELSIIVEKINSDPQIKQLRESGGVDKCIEKMKLYCVKNSDNKSVFERYFETVPYLGDLLNQYWEELQNNPLERTEAEAKIIKLRELWSEIN